MDARYTLNRDFRFALRELPDTTPLTFRAVAFTFVNAALILLTPVFTALSGISLTLLTGSLTL
jgi:hypothetical protein